MLPALPDQLSFYGPTFESVLCHFLNEPVFAPVAAAAAKSLQSCSGKVPAGRCSSLSPEATPGPFAVPAAFVRS